MSDLYLHRFLYFDKQKNPDTIGGNSQTLYKTVFYPDNARYRTFYQDRANKTGLTLYGIHGFSSSLICQF